MTHICVSKLSIIGSDNGLSPARRQAIIWTNAEILLIGSLGTNFSEILLAVLTFSFQENAFENIVCEMAAFFPRPQNVNVAHNELFNEPNNIVIPGLVSHVKVIKFGTNVGSNILINISTGVYHNCNFFGTLYIENLWQVRLWRICLIKYTDNELFNEPINICIPGHICQIQVIKFGTNKGLKILLNVSVRVNLNREKISFENLLRIFHPGTLQITVNAVFYVFLSGYFLNVAMILS